ncbi:putative alcohol dehydrogenase [Hypomontagnella monticulosa]|nr:putative alcohol dehydrogenase [Hypomontagnella monticulosa]
MPKQVIVQGSIETVEIIDTPIPTPRERDVVIKVVVSGTNPKDWKYPFWKDMPLNSGDDIAGIVYSVGKDVYEFKPGDRVAGFHECLTENGSFAEYAVAPDWMTFHIPHNISFEEAATIPTAALTAAIAMYADMKLPTPIDAMELEQGGKKMPILVYGVTSAVGAYAAKFARLSGFNPIIGVAGRAGDFAKTLADYVVDYRKGEDALVASVEEILAKEGLGTKVSYVVDAVSEKGSLEATLRFLEPNGGIVSTMLPPELFAKDGKNFKYPDGVRAFNSGVPRVFSTHKDFGYIWSRYIARLLEDGRLKPHSHEVVPGGLNGVLRGLQNLKDGRASAVKYVYRLEETGDIAIGFQDVNGNIIGTPTKVSSGRGHHKLRNFPYPAGE